MYPLFRQVCSRRSGNASKKFERNNCKILSKHFSHRNVYQKFLKTKDLACRGEHTYLYSQMLLNSLYNRNKNECIESGTFIAKRISEEIELAAREKYFF